MYNYQLYKKNPNKHIKSHKNPAKTYRDTKNLFKNPKVDIFKSVLLPSVPFSTTCAIFKVLTNLVNL